MNAASHTARTPVTRGSGPLSRNRRIVPVALILLSLIPLLAGGARLTDLVGGADVTPKNERFFASPIPVAVHIISVTVYSPLGAFQFVPSCAGAVGPGTRPPAGC